jgi:hypothetical protein
MEKIRIQDGKNSDLGSGMFIPDPPNTGIYRARKLPSCRDRNVEQRDGPRAAAGQGPYTETIDLCFESFFVKEIMRIIE